MSRKFLISITSAVAGLSVSVLSAEVFDGGWRISVGGAYNAPVKVGLNFSPIRFSGGRVALPGGYPTRADAEKIAAGTQVSDTRRNYTADGKVFVDTDDYRSAKGGMEAGTWNVQVPYDSWDGDSFVLASAEYVEVRQVGSGRGELKLNGSDESAMPGVSVELSRNLYHNKDYKFGVDIAFLFSYFFQTDLYKTKSCAQSDLYERKHGTIKSSISPVSGVREEMWRDSEGYYGAGSYYGPGPVFNDPVMSAVDGPTTLISNSSWFRARGDYRDLEMALALRPYYDILDWLRFYGTIGVAVSWSEFDLKVRYNGNNGYLRYKRRYDDWDVHGIAGLGLLARWKDFTLGFDFMARFLQDDLSIHDRIVRGSLERSEWMFRCMLGYEF